MSLPSKAFVLIVALFAWLPAEAQFLGLGFESNIELTKHDLEIIHLTVDQQVHGKPVGTTASWSNPGSGNFGTIKLLKRYSPGSRTCEAVEYTLATRKMAVPPEHYTLNSCLQPDGAWKIT
jgi:surface antigen